MVVDAQYLQSKMRFAVAQSGKDPENKFKGSSMWLSNFVKRHGISKQRKTNKKNKSIAERLPQIKNFHYWAIYKMATEEP